MPPRKSDTSKTTVSASADEPPSTTTVAGGVAGAGVGTPAKKDLDGVNIEDLNLPKSIVTRLAKGVLPPNTQIQGNAALALSKSATVFVNYLATHANEYAQSANRKTISPADVFKALEEIEFDYKDRLEPELTRFSEIQTDKRNAYRKKVADKAASAGGVEGGKTLGGAGANGLPHSKADDGHADGQPAAKRARMDIDAETAGEEGSDVVDEADGDGEEAEEGEGEGEDDVDDVDDEEGEGDDVEGEGDDPPDDGAEEDAEMDEEEREAARGAGGDEALDNGEDSD